MFLLPKSDLILFINYKLNYVAIGRLPAEIGNKATLLLPFATPVHWIFAGSSSNALNGFSLTSGVLLSVLLLAVISINSTGNLIDKEQ